MSVQLYARGSDRRTLGLLTSWSQLSLIQRRIDEGRWVLTLHDGADAELLSAGRGLIIRRDGATVDSGWRWPEYKVAATGAEQEWQIAGDTDMAVMADTNCWPTPGNAITSQPDRDFIVLGTASQRIRTLFQRNVVESNASRPGVPGMNAGASVSIGPQGTSRARFTNLLELAQQAAGTDLNFVVRQRDSDRAIALEQWTPPDRRLDIQFSPDVGTVHSWEYSDVGPEATRVVIGCGDEESGRVFRQRTSAQAGLVGSRESDWGNVRRREAFVDASDLRPGDPDVDLENEARERGDAHLVDSRRRQSFAMEVSDLPDQQFGVHFRVGDLVRAYAVPGVPIDDLIEQVEWTVDAEGGERAKVWIGPVNDPEERDALRERDMRRLIKNLEKRI